MITVVSGLPRSGTSLMMQMIVAGGMPALTDGLRAADENNPKGYFEWEAVKTLKDHPDAIAAAEGKVVKIVSAVLKQLPANREYRIVFMRRPLDEVVASQNKMLTRLGREVPSTPVSSVYAAFEKHLNEIEGWLSRRANTTVLYQDHLALLDRPREEATRIAAFLGGNLNIDRMAAQVERSLHREKNHQNIPAR
jgi:hypothetical protein